MADRVIKYVIGADTTQFENGTRVVRKNMDEMRHAGHGAASGMDMLRNSIDGVNKASAGHAHGMKSWSAFEQILMDLNMRVMNLSMGLAMLAGPMVILTRYADNYTLINSRIKLVTQSEAQLSAGREALFAISQRTRSEMEATTEVYSRVARNAKDLGLNQQELLRITESVNKSIVISGVDATASKAAIIQFGQALASGVLRGDELRSVMEQAPRLAEAIAKGMGVSIGQLREMGKEGELTAQQVVKALLSQSTAIDREYDKMAMTVGQSFTILNNAVGRWIGGADQASMASATLAAGIVYLSNNLDSLDFIIDGAGVALQVLVPILRDTYNLAHGAGLAVGEILEILKAAPGLLVPIGYAAYAAMGGVTALSGTFTALTAAITASMATNPAGWAAGIAVAFYLAAKPAVKALDEIIYKHTQLNLTGEAAHNAEMKRAAEADKAWEMQKQKALWMYKEGGIPLSPGMKIALGDLGETSAGTGPSKKKLGGDTKDPMADLSRDYASMIGKMRREIIKNDPGFDAMAEKIALARDEFDKMSARIPANKTALKQYLDTMQVELEQSIIDAQSLKDAVAETSREFQLYLQDLESQPPASPYRNFLPDDEKERILADLREIQGATEDILNQAIDNPFDRELAQVKKYYAERNKLLQDSLKKELANAGYNEDQKKELIELTTQKATALKEQQGVEETELERRKLKSMMALNAQYLSYTGALLNDLASLTDGTSRDSFEAQKALAMGATVVNTASAIMQALASMPPPASYVAAAFAAATGAIQIAKIASTSYGNGGSVGGVSAGFGAGAASGGGSGSVGSGIGGPLTGIRDAQTSESLQRLADAADNASLAIGKVADGLTSIADLFGEGTRGALLAGGLTGPAGQIPRSLLGESIKSNVLLWGRPEQVLMNQFTNMFGWGNDWYTKSTGLNLGITNGRLFGRNYADLQKDGGWFSGDDHRTDYSALNPLVRSSLEAYLGQITSTITRAAVAAGARPSFGDVTIDPVNIQTSGRTPEDIQKDLEAWFTKTADTLAQSVNGLKEFTYYGESAFDALVRLSTALQSTNEGLELIGATLINSTLQGANAAYKLQELMGGSDKFTDKIEAYFDVMFTDAEQEAMKAAQAQRQVNTAFAEMGRTVPVTRQGFRDLVGSLDLTTDRGGALFSALMDIAPAFDLVAQAADKALEALKDSTLTGVEVSLKAANALKDIIGGDYSTLSPTALYMERQAAFAAALANGRSAEIPDLGKALLESSRQYNASGAGYVSDYEAVTRALADIAGMEGSPTLSAAEQQVQLLTDIHRELEENNYSQLTVLTAQVSMQSSLNQLLSTYLKQATPEVALSNEDAARQVLRMVVGIIPSDLRWDLDKSGSVTIVDSLMAAKGSRPSFALGSPYIPYDMTANIHAGEMVIDPASSAVLRKYGIPGGDSTATVNEIKLTNIEIKQTNTELRALVSLQSEANRQMIDRLTATEARLANIEAKTRLEAAA